MTVTVTRYGPGQGAGMVAPGDFGLTHGHGFVPAGIRFAQGLRFRRDRRIFAHWNHAFLIVSPTGDLAEAGGHGIVRSTLADYLDTEYHVVHIEADDTDRAHVVDFAHYCLGRRYGYLTLASIAFHLLTGMEFEFRSDNTLICSAFVAEALERTGVVWPTDVGQVMPADLAEHYNVHP